MRTLKILNARKGPQIGQWGFWELLTTFAKYIFNQALLWEKKTADKKWEGDRGEKYHGNNGHKLSWRQLTERRPNATLIARARNTAPMLLILCTGLEVKGKKGLKMHFRAIKIFQFFFKWKTRSLGPAHPTLMENCANFFHHPSLNICSFYVKSSWKFIWIDYLLMARLMHWVYKNISFELEQSQNII